MTTCPAHGLAVQQKSGKPKSRFFKIRNRIADRFGEEVAAAFMAAVKRIRNQVDMAALESAVRAQDFARIEAALGIGRLSAELQQRGGVRGALVRTFGAMGEASSEVLASELGVSIAFDARDPNAITFARSQTAELVSRVSGDQKLGIRGVMGRAFQEGIPPRESARAVHKIVGLRADHAQAPLNLAQEIRDGHAAAATGRRLDAATKAKIRSRIANGTVTQEFIEEVQETYTHSLRRRRALDIARTETIRASSAGQEESWAQAQRKNVIPQTARRFWVVTPDDRLRETHAQVPFDNSEGVPVGEPFDTVVGAVMYPPLEVNCRCGVALVPNPATGGIL